jgi:hypothetical protein
VTCVLQDWGMELPLREQGTMLTGVRGCDIVPKHPPTIDETYGCRTVEGCVERQLSAFFRYCVLNPADPREIDIPGAWFQSRPPEQWKPSQLGHLPLHWYSHLMHSFEVVAYRHPDRDLRGYASEIYGRLVRNLHLNPETKQQMIDRLSEDRIAKNAVVS